MVKKNKQAKDLELEAADEVSAPQEAEVVETPKVEFDAWYAARAAVIPAIHKKEIIKADFKGRKVPMVATMSDFDEALRKYGVKLA